MMARQILITGGDGYLGARVTQRYLEATDAPVLLWVRADGEGEFRIKQQALQTRFGAFGERVGYAWGDLAADRPFAGLAPQALRCIVHCAAVTRFNVDATTAQRVNVEGTEKLLVFAAACPALEGLGLLSTVYSSGLRAGPIEEMPLNGAGGFANHYERSKWAAETALLTRFGDLPWQIFRVATAIADDDAGTVTRQNAFHNTLKLFYYGLLSLVPGRPETPLYFVTAQFVAEAVVGLMQRGPARTIYHVCHAREQAVTLGELIDLAFETFTQDEPFRRRGILKPLYADAESFQILADGVRAFGGGVVNQAVSSVAPFARQLFVQKEIRNSHLTSHMAGYRPLDVRALVQRTCAHLVKTRWGRQADHAA